MSALQMTGGLGYRAAAVGALALFLALPCTSATFYGTGFEPAQGYTVGNLNGQNSWVVASGSAQVTTTSVHGGVQAAQVAAGGEVTRALNTESESLVWFDTYMRATPSTNPTIPTTPRSAALFVDQTGVLLLDGDGAAGGTWVPSGYAPAPGSWFRVTIRLDFVAKTWDCYLDGVLRGIGLGFHSDSIASLSGMSVKAHNAGDTFIDDVAVTDNAGGPYPDADGDGILDTVEGEPPAAGQTNRYLADSDGDGLADGVEDANRNGALDAGETNPRNRDSDGDNLTDGIEVVVLGSDPLNASDPGPLADSDNDELPNSLDVLAPNNCDTDGDGVKDGYEAAVLGLDAVFDGNLYPQIGDVSGDGFVSNIDALLLQSLFLLKTPFSSWPGATWGDMNRDGFISNVDALIAQTRFIGNLSCIPL